MDDVVVTDPTATREAAWWDDAAGTRLAESVWGEPDWDAGVAACMAALAPVIIPARPGARLLDLGCGPGRLTIPVALALPDAAVIGVDVSAAMVRHAWAARESAGAFGCRFVTGDGRRVGDVGALDGAWSVLLFQHVAPCVASGYVEQVAVALAPGARFRFQVCLGAQRDWLGYGTSVDDASDWCTDAGLVVEALDVGLIHDEWLWVTAVKPVRRTL